MIWKEDDILTGNTLFVFTPFKINLELNAYLIYVSL